MALQRMRHARQIWPLDLALEGGGGEAVDKLIVPIEVDLNQ